MASTLRTPETIPSLSMPMIYARDDAVALRSVVKEIAGDKKRASTAALAETEGLVEAIVGTIGDPAASPGTKKASLVAAYRLASSSERAAGSLADSGSVALLLELLVDSAERSACEKALGALDAVLGSKKGREAARGHALAVPVLVKKMFRVSDLATEFAVSGLWRLFKNCGGDEERRMGLARAALSVGAFEKLLLLLQVGCSEGAKEKASELLRMLNRCRGEGEECVDTSDFRGVKRNF